jgi:hypothetical protein
MRLIRNRIKYCLSLALVFSKLHSKFLSKDLHLSTQLFELSITYNTDTKHFCYH